ncbi:MAG: HAD family hydrolase [Candidatus Heimdallarchaeota archaeon]|nr:MAG: HAD family hydrolase [Candidatus Heimdallarchaeota archaeon]
MVTQAELLKIDTIIFDFDGTLHKGDILSLPIFHECLQALYNEFQIDLKYPSDEIILSQFGKQADDIYPSLLKTTDLQIISTFEKCVEEAEVQAFNDGKGELYPNVDSTLTTLKNRKYRLALCTNARVDYFEAAVENFNLGKYFDEMMAAGHNPGKNKTWMVCKIVEKLKSKRFAVVGDRFHDIQAAKNNGGIAIGCEYGFGKTEVKEADLQITHFEELLAIFQR